MLRAGARTPVRVLSSHSPSFCPHSLSRACALPQACTLLPPGLRAPSPGCALAWALGYPSLSWTLCPTPGQHQHQGPGLQINFIPWNQEGRLCSHFLKEIPVGDDLQLLEDEEDATADKEGLMRGQGLIQKEEVAFAGPQRRADAGRAPPRTGDRTPLVPSQHAGLCTDFIF